MSIPHHRLEALSSHLQPQSPIASTMSNATTRPPITCHVLDTTTGRPAANLEVKLSCCDFSDIIFEGTTNTDGRIASWANKQGSGGAEGSYVVSKGGVIPSISAIITEQAAQGGNAASESSSQIMVLGV